MERFGKLKEENGLKRVFDLVLVATSAFLWMPAFVIIGLCQWVTSGRPILFSQTRPGLQGRPFTIYKFRTMSNSYGKDGCLLADSERLTRFGRFLRSTSLDEVPELINVIKGEMSIVGPRPLLMHYLDLYKPEQMRRHEVKPGITGWAQVNGRNAITWERKFKYDVWYVDHRSLWLDLKIVAMTVWKTLKRKDINQPGHATVEYFQGSRVEDR